MNTKRVRISKKLGTPIAESRQNSLKDWKVAFQYLRMALQEDGLEEFLDSLREVAQAYGITNLARKTGLTRQAIYKILSEKGNPHARSLWQIVHALHLRFELVEDRQAA